MIAARMAPAKVIVSGCARIRFRRGCASPDDAALIPALAVQRRLSERVRTGRRAAPSTLARAGQSTAGSGRPGSTRPREPPPREVPQVGESTD